MRIVTPSFYKNFKCIAGACPDSCCQGWEVDADLDSLAFYKTLDSSLEIKQRIDRVLDKDEFGNTIFTLAQKKRCPFLNDDNLCDMHIALGQEHTPVTCRNFPRFIYDFGGTRELGVSFSCPVAADMMYNLDGHMTFDTEINDEPPALNDIDANLYYQLINARKDIYAILWNDGIHLADRLVDMLVYAKELQSKIGSINEGGEDIDFFEVFDNPELINPQWTERLKKPQIKPITSNYSNENIAVYFIFKYFMQAVYDGDVVTPAKMAALGVLINTYFGESSWTIHLWSKETEHSQYNMDRYLSLLKTAECLKIDGIIDIIKRGQQ